MGIFRRRSVRLVALLVLLGLTTIGVYAAVQSFLIIDPGSDGNGVLLRDPDNPCGSISVALVSLWLNRPVSLSLVNRDIEADGFGRTSMSDLLTGLKHAGFAAEAIQLPCRPVVDTHLPLIVHLSKSHWAVLAKNQHGVCVLLDPPHDPRDASDADYLQQWDGAAILVAEDKDSLLAGLQQLGITRTDEKAN